MLELDLKELREIISKIDAIVLTENFDLDALTILLSELEILVNSLTSLKEFNPLEQKELLMLDKWYDSIVLIISKQRDIAKESLVSLNEYKKASNNYSIFKE